MAHRTTTEELLYLGEEIANSITHGFGLLLSIAGLIALVSVTASRGTTWQLVSCSIYGATLVLLYLASTLYHALAMTRARRVFRIIDHSAIFLLIAGTYTPFVLICLRNWFGYTLLATVWAVSICGVVFKAIWIDGHGIISTVIYAALGWVSVFAIKPLLQVLPASGMWWLVAGGVAYTAGIVFFASTWKYAHTIWHVFVLAGSVCHFVAVFVYLVLR